MSNSISSLFGILFFTFYLTQQFRVPVSSTSSRGICCFLLELLFSVPQFRMPSPAETTLSCVSLSSTVTVYCVTPANSCCMCFVQIYSSVEELWRLNSVRVTQSWWIPIIVQTPPFFCNLQYSFKVLFLLTFNHLFRLQWKYVDVINTYLILYT